MKKSMTYFLSIILGLSLIACKPPKPRVEENHSTSQNVSPAPQK